MTREEAIEELEQLLRHWDDLENGKRCFWGYDKEAVALAISAIRPVSRELVEQVWGGMWIYDPDTGYAYCEMCKHTICQTDYLNGKLPPFCEMCGAPMTDEAVEMVIERIISHTSALDLLEKFQKK